MADIIIIVNKKEVAVLWCLSVVDEGRGDEKENVFLRQVLYILILINCN